MANSCFFVDVLVYTNNGGGLCEALRYGCNRRGNKNTKNKRLRRSAALFRRAGLCRGKHRDGHFEDKRQFNCQHAGFPDSLR